MKQKNDIHKRLGERRRSRARSTSMNDDQTLSLNLSKVNQNNRRTSTDLRMNQTVDVPAMGRSSLPPTAQRPDLTNNDDTLNKSNTSQGTSLANRINLCIARILAATNQQESHDDQLDLTQLLKELNNHTELSVKLSSVSKVAKMLGETSSSQKPDAYQEIKQNKQGAGLNFKSKLKLEMKQVGSVNPKVIQILRAMQKSLEKI